MGFKLEVKFFVHFLVKNEIIKERAFSNEAGTEYNGRFVI